MADHPHPQIPARHNHVTKPTVSKFALIDHCLSGAGGHPFRMAEIFLESLVSNEAWGRVGCALNDSRVHPHFTLCLWAPGWCFPAAPAPDAASWRKLRHPLVCLLVMLRTNALYRRELSAVPRADETIWFAPNTSLYNLPGLLFFAACHRRQRIVCYLQTTPSRHLRLCGLLLRWAHIKRVRFVSETDAMSAACTAALKVPVVTLLYPLLAPRWINKPLLARPDILTCFRIAVLGLPRREKGFHWLPALADALRHELEHARICFVVQVGAESCESEDLADSVTALRQIPNVELIESALGPEQYLHTLQRADIVFTPYTLSGYAQRLSWISIEGLALGKPVVITANTLAADMLRQLDCGVAVAEGDVLAMAAAIREIIANYREHEHRAHLAAQRFREENSSDRFFARLDELFRESERS